MRRARWRGAEEVEEQDEPEDDCPSMKDASGGHLHRPSELWEPQPLTFDLADDPELKNRQHSSTSFPASNQMNGKTVAVIFM